VTDFLREVRPSPTPGFEVRFENPPGEQAQVDFAQFEVVFTDESSVTRIVCEVRIITRHDLLLIADALDRLL
jgi:transposase